MKMERKEKSEGKAATDRRRDGLSPKLQGRFTLLPR